MFTNVQTKRIIAGSSALCGVVLVGAAIWRYRRSIVATVEIGPYATESANFLKRGLQRILVDKTRVDHRENWNPSSSFLTIEPNRSSDNGHGVSGAARDAARSLMSSAISAMGRQIIEISPGGHTVGQNKSIHQHYAVGDLHQGIKSDEMGPDDILMGVDIDYYLVNPDRYLGHPNLAIFYTFQPTEVSGLDGDTPFRITSDTVEYGVSGGGSWSHKVWDWCGAGEFIEFRRHNGLKGWLLRNILGLDKITYQKVHFARPFKRSPHRAIVWCVPQFSCWRFTWIPMEIKARKLKRVEYRDNRTPGWNSIISLSSSNELMISLGREGEDASVSLRKTDYDVLMGLLSAQSVTTRMIGMKYIDPKIQSIVGQYFRKGTSENPCAPRLGKPVGPSVHWPSSMDAESPETSFRVYGAPLVSDANFVPMTKRWECLSMSLNRRVEIVRNDKTPPPKYQRFAEEFVRLVVPQVGEGVPYSLEDTAALLDKPTQALAIKQIWETVDSPHRRLIESFVKNEPTMKTGRIISSFADMRFLLHFSKYTLQFRDEVLHSETNAHWFCPGLSPPEIATKVQEYCSTVHIPIEGDFTNFDGTVSSWCQRHVMNAVYHRHFGRSFQSELYSYTDMLVNCPARAKKFGFKYDAGVGVKSGSPTTCDLNTVLNAFIQYCAIRCTNSDLTPEDAFRSIGLAFGDDSLFDKSYARAFAKVAEHLGMSLKIESTDPEQGITFLARVFPDPTNTTTSFQDPLRTWRKLHLTARDPNVPIYSAALDRITGYLVTDALTPLTSDYANMIVRNYTPTAESLEKRRSRTKCDSEKPYWLTIGGAWPQKIEDYDKMFNTICARTGLDPSSMRETIERLRNCTDPWSPDITINRNEEPVKLVDTLDDEGLPCEGEVDARKHNNDRATNHHRIIPAPSLGIKQRPSSVLKRDGQRNINGEWQRREGCRRIPRISQQNKDAVVQHNDDLFGQTNSPTVLRDHKPNEHGPRSKRFDQTSHTPGIREGKGRPWQAEKANQSVSRGLPSKRPQQTRRQASVVSSRSHQSL